MSVNIRKLLMIMPFVSGIVPFSSCPALGANIVANGSFESSPVLPNGGPSDYWGVFGSVTGWSATNYIEIWSGNGNAPYEGNQLAELDPYSNTEIYQLLPTVPEHMYAVSFAYRRRPHDPAGFTAISLFWDGALIDTVNTREVSWSVATYVLSAANAPTEIRFAAAGVSDSYGDHLDAVSVSAIPEPSSALLVLGGVVLLALRHKALMR